MGASRWLIGLGFLAMPFVPLDAAAQSYPPPYYPRPYYPPPYYPPPDREYYPPPDYYERPPLRELGTRCNSRLPPGYSARRLVCDIVRPRPLGQPCVCPPPEPPPGYPPGPYLDGRVVR